MPKISVIVPVYNTGILVKECLESLFNQTYNDFEIIIVNDGSTDESEDVILHCVKGMGNCKYIYQENQGLSSARNTGLDSSNGDFIAFIDSDDWVERDFLEIMISEIEEYNADICMCGYYRKLGDKILSKTIPRVHCSYITDEDDLINFYYKTFIEEKYGIICCNKLYRKSLISEHSLRFEKNNEIYAEDLLFNTRFLLSAERIVETSTLLYNYRIREGSITQAKKPLLEARYSELLSRIEIIIKHRLPNKHYTLLSLIQYEAINVLTTNSYKYTHNLKDILKTIMLYENAGGKVIKRLKGISSVKETIANPKKEFTGFFLLLDTIIIIKQPWLVGFVFWIKLSIVNIGRNSNVN
ncbi:glycosyltransferase family 2 protein [Cytobacillus firmus]|uniref:glycosyltransferase family 2 protein n=1 Tax=Cytobacillus firmus TaxID=1399 RepID=UPI0018CEBE10|nr:glycosyltransferase [Cytobacillus firmus]